MSSFRIPQQFPSEATVNSPARSVRPGSAPAVRPLTLPPHQQGSAVHPPDPSVHRRVRLKHLYISDGHNFRGHHGRPPGAHDIAEVAVLECVSGRGIIGDRYFDYRDDYKGQISFFDWNVYVALTRRIGASAVSPSALRRNVVISGIDLNVLIGRTFNIDGVHFEGTEECRPCYWMDHAIGTGAEDFLKGRGGLRAKILGSGLLVEGGASLAYHEGDGQ